MSCATEKAAFWQSKYPLTATKSSRQSHHRHERPLSARTRREGCLRKRFRAAQGALYGGNQVSDNDIGAFLNRDREHPDARLTTQAHGQRTERGRTLEFGGN